jgi:major vault protein
MSENRERDLVLAPNEFAFISDQTKGNVITYVGPYKTSMANTDKPVLFNKKTKQFEICPLENSIQTFMACPEGWYIVLKNPASDNKPPQIGTSNQLSILNIGRKVNLPGPAFFALWPGQMAEVIEGHFLRSNDYLIVRVYEERQARENWANAVITPQSTNPEGLEDENSDIDRLDASKLTMGQLLIIRGTDVSFYIPPTGIEVVQDQNSGNFVRKAVTLERLEYCILLDEDGNKRYIQGPDVVFPSPTERFVEKDGIRKFKAIELNENSGIYVKIIAPYDENGKQYKVGDELFITGKEQMIYFPRPEHALIKYGEQDIYYAVAIPPGEGRYYLNRNTGKIALKQGPCMFLPDPREEVIVRRVLSPKQVRLWFPGNEEALNYNLHLQALSIEEEKKSTQEESSKSAITTHFKANISQTHKKEEQVFEGIVGNSFSRSTSFSKPRTITLNNKYEGAVTIDVWTGYAILVTSKTGERKVIVGPATYLLAYDEVLQPVELSTGTPKVDDKLLNTVYMRTLNNKVSDVVRAETKDFCNVDIKMSYRVNFTGEPVKWFNVENYVKFLTDHLRSVVRNALKQINISDFYANGISIMRDIVLGTKKEGETSRSGWLFEENGMHVYEVEILDIEIQDNLIQDLLFKSKHEEIRKTVDLSTKEKELIYTLQTEKISREIAETKSLTKNFSVELAKQENQKQLELELAKMETQLKLQREELELELEEAAKELEINKLKLEKEKEIQTLQQQNSEILLNQKIKELEAQVKAVVDKAEAVSPDLIAALQAFGDKALAEKMAETMAPLSIIGGKSIVEVFANLLHGTQLEKVLKLKADSAE